jgi:hypothetical protein
MALLLFTSLVVILTVTASSGQSWHDLDTEGTYCGDVISHHMQASCAYVHLKNHFYSCIIFWRFFPQSESPKWVVRAFHEWKMNNVWHDFFRHCYENNSNARSGQLRHLFIFRHLFICIHIYMLYVMNVNECEKILLILYYIVSIVKKSFNILRYIVHCTVAWI